MVEATIEDLAITIRFSRETIWGYPHIVGEDVLSTTFLKDYRAEQSWEQRLSGRDWELARGVPQPPRRAVREWRKKSSREQNHS
jgi:hypothetical protein